MKGFRVLFFCRCRRTRNPEISSYTLPLPQETEATIVFQKTMEGGEARSPRTSEAFGTDRTTFLPLDETGGFLCWTQQP